MKHFVPKPKIVWHMFPDGPAVRPPGTACGLCGKPWSVYQIEPVTSSRHFTSLREWLNPEPGPDDVICSPAALSVLEVMES